MIEFNDREFIEEAMGGDDQEDIDLAMAYGKFYTLDDYKTNFICKKI